MTSRNHLVREAAERLGQRAERSFAFWSAARWYREAARRAVDDPERAAFARMRAARALQKAENWRTQTAGWESLGDAIGLQIAAASAAPEADFKQRYRPDAGRELASEFGVISDAEWHALRTKHETLEDVRRHHQAWAYEWAAEVAAANREFVVAARLFRRAGVSWEKSKRTDLWRRAANCYFQAALAAAQTARHATRRGIHACAWCPSCLRDKSTEDRCTHDGQPERLDAGGEGKGTDLQRLSRCWIEVAKETSEPDVLHEACRQISAIQRQLAVAGSRDDAIVVYRFLHRFRRAYFALRHSYPQLWLSRFGALTWGNGSSLRHLLGTIIVFYVLIAPLLWLAADVIEPFSEAVLFSLANLANTAGDHFPRMEWLATLFQVLQALSGFVALGVTLWVAQRSYA